MNDESSENELTSELAAYQERLDRGIAGHASDTQGASASSDQEQNFAEQKRCLDLLHALRKPEPVRGKPAYRHEPDQADQAAQVSERFHRLDELGSGGFGVVWRARDPVTGRIVALKIPRPEVLASRELWKRFEQEAEAAARLDHPNIVPILEAGADGVVPYIASVYYEGPTLARWLAEHPGPVPPRQAALVALTLAKALTHAHERGVLHRDVKPSNVLLAPLDGGEHRELAFEPKLMDFGLAKLGERDHELTRTGAMLGTLKYMAPEQAAGRAKEITAATDVYGLGVVLYEMLAGKPPFSAESDWLTLRQVLEDEPRSVSSIRRDVPRDLAVIVQKCLSKLPAQRYRTARELAEDLDRYLSGKAILARPVPTLERLAKWCRRNPAWAALVAVVAVALLSGIAFLSYSNLRIAAALDAEQKTREQLAMRLYASDIQRADEAIKRQNVRHASDILQQYASAVSGVDRREFAWHYLESRLPRQRAFVPQHSKAVYSIDLSPNKQLLGTACADGRVRVWTTAGKLVFEFACDPAEPNEVAFSPDGRWLAAASDDGLVRVWEAGTWAVKQTFEIGGVITTDINQFGDTARAIAIQENGAIVVAGDRLTKDYDGIVARYSPNGGLDRSFNSKGVQLVWSMPNHQRLYGVLVDPDGKVVLAGHSRSGNFAVARLTPDGADDHSFGDHGSVFEELGTGKARALAIVRQPDGKYIVAGACMRNGQDDSAIIRLLPDGKLDPTFGVEGVTINAVGNHSDYISSIALQADGKIVAAGTVALQKDSRLSKDTTVLRYNSDGKLDTSFARQGVLIAPLADLDDAANHISVSPDNRIVVSGHGILDGQPKAVVFRLNPDGSFDSSFADQGIRRFDFQGEESAARCALPLPDGKILVGGISGTGHACSIALKRLEPDGEDDATFGRASIATLSVGCRTEMHCMARQPDGKVVVGGFAQLSSGAISQNLLIARFLPDGSRDRTLSTNGAQGVRFTADSKQLVAYADQAVRLWDIESGTLVGQFQATIGSLKTLDLSGDGKRMGVACDCGFEVRDMANLTKPLTCKPMDTALASMALSPEDDVILGLARGELELHSLSNEFPVRVLETGSSRRPRKLRESLDRRWLTTISDNIVSVYETDKLSRVAELAAQNRILDARMGPSDDTVLTSAIDGSVLEWPLKYYHSSALSGARRVLYNTRGWIASCALSPNEKILAVGHHEGMVCLIDTDTGRVLHRLDNQKSDVEGMAFTTDDQLVIGYASGSVVTLNITNKAVREAISLGQPIFDLIAAPDGRRIGIVLDNSPTVEVFDADDFKLISRIRIGGSGTRSAFSTHGDRIAVAGGGKLEVFNVATRELLASESGLGNTYDDVEVFQADERFVVAERSNGITVRELNGGKVLRRLLTHGVGDETVTVTRDGRNLASIGFDQILRIWDTQSYEQLLTLKPNSEDGRIWGLLFSKDGRTLFGIGDSRIVAWDTQ